MRTALVSVLAAFAAAPGLLGQGAARPATPTVATITTITGRGQVYSVAPALDGRRIYYFADDTLFMYDVATRRSSHVSASPMPMFDMTVSVRGDLLAFSRRETRNTPAALWATPLNPATGMATGPARRVSLSPGADVPAISPDGKWIAFARDSAREEMLTVVPSNGGVERVLATSRWLLELRWSPDGQWIHYREAFADRDGGILFRVAVRGGTPERVAETASAAPGLSPDGRHVAYFRAHAGIWSLGILNSGVSTGGEFWGQTISQWLSSTALLLWESARPNGLKSYSFANGTIRDVLPTTENIREIAWAPDGRSFAGVSIRGDTAAVIVANADGSTRRRVQLPHPRRAEDLTWSPNSRHIALTSGDVSRVFVIDVVSGALQQLRTPGLAERPQWTSDSRRIRYLTGTPLNEGGTRTIREASLDGRDVVVREIGRRVDTYGRLVAGVFNYEGAGGWDMWFVSDTAVIVKDTSAAHLVSLTTGRSVRLLTGETGMPSVSPRGDRIAMRPLGNGPAGSMTDAVIVTPSGERLGTMTFPLGVGQGVLRRHVFTPDGASVIATGRDADFRCCSILIGALGGGAPRKLASVEQGSGAPRLALSPDGQTLLFTSAGKHITTIRSFDISALLRQPSSR